MPPPTFDKDNGVVCVDHFNESFREAGNDFFKSIMNNLRSGAPVFFGATGDLAYKKIFPSP